MQLHLIYARAANGVIGANNTLPWHLPEDMAHFKRLTLGCPVIMGRKTWDSLPARFRPLPGRKNVVVTRQAGLTRGLQDSGAQVAHSLQDAIAQCADHAHVWVIGGANLYGQALPLAHSAEVTEIEQDFEGDAYAPDLGQHWVQTAREQHVSAQGLKFSFATYVNQKAAGA
jgi:dihydrofolate reductase